MAVSDEQKAEALQVYTATIKNCQKMLIKFAEGTSQHSLLINRIAALQVVAGLVGDTKVDFTHAQLAAAVAPIKSIIHKTSVARAKFAPDKPTYKRLTPMIEAMEIGLSALHAQLDRKSG
jgi:hypothetical protein